MRFLVLSDIHGNFEALQAVLADAPMYDSTICLGDTVGYGPNPNECVDAVRSLPGVTCLIGNHDLAALGQLNLSDFNPFARKAAVWTDAHLKADVRAYLGSLTPSKQAYSMHLAHASPRDPVWEYMEESSQGPPNFAAFSEQTCFVGHTHVPRVFENDSAGQARVYTAKHGHSVTIRSGSRKIINPGGVGQPRDGDPRASYGLLDTTSQTFVFRRVPYPIDRTQEKILKAGLPAPLAYRLASGL
ncbi:MAG: metallophosphoesterase family protein [Chloroflexota bacterium]